MLNLKIDLVAACALVLPLLPGCGGNPPTSTDRPGAVFPLTDMGPRAYKGFSGGLYPGGNDAPAAHAAAGVQRARLVMPLDAAGNPSSSGKYVLLSMGMSNTTQ